MKPQAMSGPDVLQLGAPKDWNPETDGNCETLAVIVTVGDGPTRMTSSWLPDEHDLAMLNAGAPVLLDVVGGSHPPVWLAVGQSLAGPKPRKLRPQRQLDETDCYRTCLACILDMDAADVPNFVAEEEEWVPHRDRWLLDRGWAVGRIRYFPDVDLAMVLAITAQDHPNVPLILSGLATSGGNHAVVVLNGAIVCNPNDSRLIGPADYPGGEKWWGVNYLSPGVAS